MASPVENISAIATLELFLISEYSRELKSDRYSSTDEGIACPIARDSGAGVDKGMPNSSQSVSF